MRLSTKLLKLILITAILSGILLVTDVNRLNIPEEIGRHHLFSILDWEVRRLPNKWSYKIKSLIKNDHESKSNRLELSLIHI